MAMQRMIRMVETRVDPLDPPKFKRRRLPRGNRSPPVPLMHSPPRPLTLEDQKVWRVPPCVSNWKNPQGYTIPLDKRCLDLGGRGLQQVQVSDNFAPLLEALYAAEQQVREAASMRSKVLVQMMLKEKEKKEKLLLAMAQKARFVNQHTQISNNQEELEKIREERRKERERERRLEGKVGKMRKITVEEGMASCEVNIMYDERLFNQEKGMDSGFGFATGDQYKPFFTAADPFGLDHFITHAMRSAATVGY